MLPAEKIFKWCKLNKRNSVTRRHLLGSLSDHIMFVKDRIMVVLRRALWSNGFSHWDGRNKPLGKSDEMTMTYS